MSGTLCDSDMWGSELSFAVHESCIPFPPLPPTGRHCLPASFRHYGVLASANASAFSLPVAIS
jgi:hypothetical protein